MTKVFIDVFDCKTPHKIFTGKNALLHAVFFIHTGRICDDANYLFKLNPKFDMACSWHKSDHFHKAEDELAGNGVHMKRYEYKNHLILSSQNQVNSSLFEFAIVYEKRNKLSEFFYKSFKRASDFSKWFVRNSQYKLNIKNLKGN